MQTFNVEQVPSRIGNYLAGFTDGDGSFCVCFSKNKNLKKPWRISLHFVIGQKEKVILSQFKKHLKCGKIREVKSRNGIYEYRVENFNAIQTNVIPFFQRFGFLTTKKKRDFVKFQQIARLIEKKEHLTVKGIKKILKIRKDMNDGGSTNRYSDEKILGEIYVSSKKDSY
jgi:hypothetical protein